MRRIDPAPLADGCVVTTATLEPQTETQQNRLLLALLETDDLPPFWD